jgi:hypothetical protein
LLNWLFIHWRRSRHFSTNTDRDRNFGSANFGNVPNDLEHRPFLIYAGKGGWSVAVLEMPPVESPQVAVKAAEARKEKK